MTAVCSQAHLELVLVVGDPLYLGPGEADLGRELVADVVEVDSEGVDPEENLDKQVT